MYEWDDILIVGDSWCSERDKPIYWPNQLLFELTEITKGIPRGRGFAGCSWWSIRKELFKQLNSKPAKVVIIFHTDASRIPSDIDRAFTTNIVFKKNNNDKVNEAAAEYYKHIYSANFYNWAERRWFRELDSFLEEKKVEKIIHLYGYVRHREQKYIFKNGVNIDYSMIRHLTMNTSTMRYPNHMTYENNQKLAYFLSNLIVNYPGHGFVYRENPFKK